MSVYPRDPPLSPRCGMPGSRGTEVSEMQFLPSLVPQKDRAVEPYLADLSAIMVDVCGNPGDVLKRLVIFELGPKRLFDFSK